MKRKSKIILSGAIALVLCCALLYAFMPYFIAPDPNQLQIQSVRRVTENAEYQDITGQVDLDALAQQIAVCRASRLPTYQNSYSLDAVQYEIDVLYQEKPLHLVLGADSFVYQSGPWNHRLHDAQNLTDALDAMLTTGTAA